MIAAVLSLLLALASAATDAPERAPELDCSIGPVTKIYGGSDWRVYSCSDGQSVVAVTAEGSPAAPFYFMLQRTGDKIRLYGEGVGTKSATQPAYEALSRLSAADIAALVIETRQAPSARKQTTFADPKGEAHEP